MKSCLTIALACAIIILVINLQRVDFLIIPNVAALKMCRTKQGLSARALALKASLNVSTVAGIEKTGHPVAPATAKAVCDALGVPFGALFTFDMGAAKAEDKQLK